MYVGINKPGGTARILEVHDGRNKYTEEGGFDANIYRTELGNSITYNVKYVLTSQIECDVPHEFVKKHEVLERTSRARKSVVALSTSSPFSSSSAIDSTSTSSSSLSDISSKSSLSRSSTSHSLKNTSQIEKNNYRRNSYPADGAFNSNSRSNKRKPIEEIALNNPNINIFTDKKSVTKAYASKSLKFSISKNDMSWEVSPKRKLFIASSTISDENKAQLANFADKFGAELANPAALGLDVDVTHLVVGVGSGSKPIVKQRTMKYLQALASKNRNILLKFCHSNLII